MWDIAESLGNYGILLRASKGPQTVKLSTIINVRDHLQAQVIDNGRRITHFMAERLQALKADRDGRLAFQMNCILRHLTFKTSRMLKISVVP